MSILLLFLVFIDPGTAEKLSLYELLRNNQVVIVGETHRRPESARLIAEAVTEYLQRGKCLIVALEIPSDRQSVLERALFFVVFCNDIPSTGSGQDFILPLKGKDAFS